MACAVTGVRLQPSPFPSSRSSMFYDEDGDLAHEFYEETIVTKNGQKRAKLRRVHKNLIPQVRGGAGVLAPVLSVRETQMVGLVGEELGGTGRLPGFGALS